MPPTRWEASQRPLFVKTVWISGARHAILTHDDPARLNTAANTFGVRRTKRKVCSSATSIKTTKRTGQSQQPTVEACLSNKSLVLPVEESPPTPDQFTDRVCQWLETAGKVRPPTPFEGALWESPRGDILDLTAGPLRLATKNIELNLTCTTLCKPRSRDSTPSETRSPSPGLVQTFAPPKLMTARSCSSGTRPQLHIFMPLVQANNDRAKTLDIDTNMLQLSRI